MIRLGHAAARAADVYGSIIYSAGVTAWFGSFRLKFERVRVHLCWKRCDRYADSGWLHSKRGFHEVISFQITTLTTTA